MSHTMTRRHFQAIADTLRLEVRPQFAHDLNAYGRIVEAFADLCRGSNPRFDEGRFERACHPRVEAIKAAAE